MRRSILLLLLSTLALPVWASGEPVFAWWKDGRSAWSVSLGPAPLDGLPEPVWERPTPPRIPPFSASLFRGGTISRDDAAGKVLVIDFWASWCAPCLKELPHLEALWKERKGSDFLAVAINSDEPDDVAIRASHDLGLTLPVARFEGELYRELGVRNLPTLLIVDRAGRIRERWNGYSEGLEAVVARRVRELLQETTDTRPVGRKLAEMTSGTARLEALWAREVPAAVSGIAVLERSRLPEIATSGGGVLSLFDGSGKERTKLRVPAASWRLAAAPPGADSGVDLVAWRQGAADLFSLDLDGGMLRPWTSPSPVLDAAFQPGSAGGRLVLATLGGVVTTGATGDGSSRMGPPLPLRSVLPSADGTIAVLDDAEKLATLGADGKKGAAAVVPAGSWWLVCPDGAGAYGVAPGNVVSFACGKLGRRSEETAALATGSGELILVDLAARKVVHRSRWPALTALAAADLDGDGRDELIVGAGRLVAALTAAP